MSPCWNIHVWVFVNVHVCLHMYMSIFLKVRILFYAKDEQLKIKSAVWSFIVKLHARCVLPQKTSLGPQPVNSDKQSCGLPTSSCGQSVVSSARQSRGLSTSSCPSQQLGFLQCTNSSSWASITTSCTHTTSLSNIFPFLEEYLFPASPGFLSKSESWVWGKCPELARYPGRQGGRLCIPSSGGNSLRHGSKIPATFSVCHHAVGLAVVASTSRWPKYLTETTEGRGDLSWLTVLGWVHGFLASHTWQSIVAARTRDRGCFSLLGRQEAETSIDTEKGRVSSNS